MAARKLLAEPCTQAEIRRAASTAYYAMFHHLCACFAEIVLHPAHADFSRARLQAYRFLEHGTAKARCLEARASARQFPAGIVQFSETFVKLQERRLEADYDPAIVIVRGAAEILVNNAEAAIAAFDREAPEHRRAFAIFAALKQKGRG
ncbi:MAG: hypothetical protein ACKVON_16140 [Beijerinckiaceae bacterium]